MKPGSHHSAVRLGLDLCRFLFRLFPPDFRREYEVWVLQAFRDQSFDAVQGRGLRGLMRLWMTSIPDVITSALCERLEGSSMNWQDLFHSSPRSRPGFWMLGFTLLTLAAFPITWLVMLALGRVLGAPLFDLEARRLLMNANISYFVLALALGTCQSLAVGRAGLSAKGWLVATSVGWFAGSLLASKAWAAHHYWTALFFWQRLRFLVGVSHALVVGVIMGLLVGLAQWLVLRRRARRPFLWIPFSIAALTTQLLVQDGLMDRLVESGLLRFVPLIIPAAIGAAGLALLLRDSGREEESPRRPPHAAFVADPT